MLGMAEGRIYGENIANGDPSYKKRIGYVLEIAELYDSLTACEIYRVKHGRFLSCFL